VQGEWVRFFWVRNVRRVIICSEKSGWIHVTLDDVAETVIFLKTSGGRLDTNSSINLLYITGFKERTSKLLTILLIVYDIDLDK
jgi:hypothetical protein